MTTYTYEFVVGGRNIGSHPFRDPNATDFAYTLRDVPDGLSEGLSIEFVKINVTTGALATQGPTWLKSANLGTLGACFVNGGTTQITWDTNVCGPPDGSGNLYIVADDFNVDFTHNTSIIEFDETTLDITNSWVVATNVAVTRGVGTSIVSPGVDRFVVNGARQVLDGGGHCIESRIQLFKPSNAAYGFIDILAQTGESIACGNQQFESPICFDDDGFLWIVTYPIMASGFFDYVTGKSHLRKFSIVDDTLGNLTLTQISSFEIQDDFHAYGTSAFAATYHFLRISFDLANDKIYTWSAACATQFALEQNEGWFFEFDPVGETFTRSAVTFTPGTKTQQRSPYDLINWTGGISSFVTIKQAVVGTPTYCLFNIATEVLTEYPIVATWTFDTTDTLQFNNWTNFFSDGSFEIYAFDAKLHVGGGGVGPYTYSDALFFAVDAVPVAIVEEMSIADTTDASIIAGGNVSETMSIADTTDVSLITNRSIVETMSIIDTVDAVFIPVTRSKWMTIGGDARTSIFPN